MLQRKSFFLLCIGHIYSTSRTVRVYMGMLICSLMCLSGLGLGLIILVLVLALVLTLINRNFLSCFRHCYYFHLLLYKVSWIRC